MHNPSLPRVGRWSGGLLAMACAWALAGCGGGASEDSTNMTPKSSSTAPSVLSPTATATATATAAPSTEGRLLASNCFQCHGTNGTGGFDSIRGGEAQEIMEFLTKPASKEIMAAHAQGYTTAQLQKIIAYLQQ